MCVCSCSCSIAAFLAILSFKTIFFCIHWYGTHLCPNKWIGSLLDSRQKTAILTHCLFLYSSFQAYEIKYSNLSINGVLTVAPRCFLSCLPFHKGISCDSVIQNSLNMSALLCTSVIFYLFFVLSRVVIFTPFPLYLSNRLPYIVNNILYINRL